MKIAEIGFVYMITSPNGRLYIGSTIDIEQRFDDYKYYQCKGQKKLHSSLKKYGSENHMFEIIWAGPLEEMYKYETLIGWGFNVLEDENMNLQLPKLGDIYSATSEETRKKMSISAKARKRILGRKCSEETKEKIRKANLGKTNWLGKTHSKESIEKMRNSQLGIKPTEETREKLSLSKLGNTNSKGIKHTKEHVEKRAKSTMKSVLQYSLDGTFIKEWESATTASKYLNLNKCSIRLCCRGILKTSGGFIWKQSQPKPN